MVKKIDGNNISDLAVVPLAIPITIGPGTIGILLVLGASFKSTTNLIIGSFALICAVVVIGIMLYSSSIIKKSCRTTRFTYYFKVYRFIFSRIICTDCFYWY